jgi:CubicO group peptidase (beta-lactamase class C family)
MAGIPRQAVIDACDYADRWLAFQRRHLRVPGVQAAVLHDDEVVLSTAHGVSDVTTGEPLTTDHLFRIASHSKTFTATCVMQLAERGLLRLDDTVGHWIDGLDAAPIAGVTLRELLAHAGGVVRDGWDGDFWQLFHAFPDETELVRIAADASSVLPRNERFKYSNIGYSLLGMVIAEASGRSYHEYVVDEVVARLGLANTGPELDPARAHEYAGGHASLDYADERLPIEHVDTHAMASATGFYSTASDVVRYAAGHFHGDDRLLSDDSKRQMQKTEWEVEGTGTSYGLGFGISTIGTRRLLGHGGGYPGHITRTYFDPVDRLAVSVLTNAIDGPAMGMAGAIVSLIDLAAGGPGPAGDDRSRFCGRFTTLWGTYDVVDLYGTLYQLTPTLADPTSSYAVLEVVDDHTLRIARSNGYGSRGEVLAYTFDDDGSVRSVRGGSANTAFPYERYRQLAASADRVTLGGGLRD